jgi:hypothetical protein
MGTLAAGAPLLAGGPPGWVAYGVLAVVTVGGIVYVASQSTSNADSQADKKLATGAAADACSTCQPPECKDTVKKMDEKNRKLKKELNKYDPASDAKGGHTYKTPDGVTRTTVPGGHYKEIRDIQRGLKNELEKYNKQKCYSSPGPTDKITREAAQKGVSQSIEVPPGFPSIPL